MMKKVIFIGLLAIVSVAANAQESAADTVQSHSDGKRLSVGGYGFGKGWTFNTEIEFEHGGSGGAIEKEGDEGGEWEAETEKGGEVELEQYKKTADYAVKAGRDAVVKFLRSI